MTGRIQLLGASMASGLAMRGAAHLAADPRWEWLQWVVNWGALWTIVPFFAGRRSDRVPVAGLLGALAGASEVAVYYGPTHLVAYKVAWLAIGAGACAVIGLIGRLSRRHGLGTLAVPLLMVLEPIGVGAVFLLLGRDLGPHWVASSGAEFAVGSIGVAVLTSNRIKGTLALHKSPGQSRFS